jgi:hypothetical protein
MPEFTSGEQALLDDLVRRRTTTFKRPFWMQSHRARAIKAEVTRLIGASPAPSFDLAPGDSARYSAATRVRYIGGERSLSKYKIHEAGSDGRPICTMGQEADWRGEMLGPGAVTCGKCAATRDQ